MNRPRMLAQVVRVVLGMRALPPLPLPLTQRQRAVMEKGLAQLRAAKEKGRKGTTVAQPGTGKRVWVPTSVLPQP